MAGRQVGLDHGCPSGLQLPPTALQHWGGWAADGWGRVESQLPVVTSACVPPPFLALLTLLTSPQQSFDRQF